MALYSPFLFFHRSGHREVDRAAVIVRNVALSSVLSHLMQYSKPAYKTAGLMKDREVKRLKTDRTSLKMAESNCAVLAAALSIWRCALGLNSHDPWSYT
jgi:hypothetical protein